MKFKVLNKFLDERGFGGKPTWVNRMLREAGHVPKGRGGYGGSHSPEMSPVEVAKLLAVLCCPLGPEYAIARLADVESEIYVLAGSLTGSLFTSETPVWRIAHSGVVMTGAVSGDLIAGLIRLIRREREEGATEMSSLGSAA
jgi:hypothetical protein